MQHSRFDSIKDIWCTKQSYQKTKHQLKKNLFIWEKNKFIFCAVKHILENHEKTILENVVLDIDKG